MNKKIGNLFKGDKGIWMVFFFLCLISLIEVFSASSTLSFKSHNYMGPIIYHAGTILFGIVITIVLIAQKLYRMSHAIHGFRQVTDQPLFYLALLAMVFGLMLFLAGYLAELVVRNGSDRNKYLISDRIE